MLTKLSGTKYIHICFTYSAGKFLHWWQVVLAMFFGLWEHYVTINIWTWMILCTMNSSLGSPLSWLSLRYWCHLWNSEERESEFEMKIAATKIQQYSYDSVLWLHVMFIYQRKFSYIYHYWHVISWWIHPLELLCWTHALNWNLPLRFFFIFFWYISTQMDYSSFPWQQKKNKLPLRLMNTEALTASRFFNMDFKMMNTSFNWPAWWSNNCIATAKTAELNLQYGSLARSQFDLASIEINSGNKWDIVEQWHQ